MPLACSGATEAVPTLLKYSLKMHARIQPCRRILQHPLEPGGEHDEHVAAIQRLTGGRAVLCLAFEDMKVGRWGRELERCSRGLACIVEALTWSTSPALAGSSPCFNVFSTPSPLQMEVQEPSPMVQETKKGGLLNRLFGRREPVLA